MNDSRKNNRSTVYMYPNAGGSQGTLIYSIDNSNRRVGL